MAPLLVNKALGGLGSKPGGFRIRRCSPTLKWWLVTSKHRRDDTSIEVHMGKQSRNQPLIGWKTIADYLGQPTSTAQRWAKEGVPVTRKGGNVVASAQELSQWLGKQSGQAEPVHITQEEAPDLLGELRRGLRQAHVERPSSPRG